MIEKPILRELSVGELLDKAFRLYRAQVLPLLGITSVVLIPTTLLQILSVLLWQDARILDSIQSIFFTSLIEVALIAAISQIYLSKPFSIKQAFGLGWKRYFSVLGAELLIGLAISVPVFFIAICSMLASGLSVLAFIAIIPLAVFLGTRWAIASEVIVLEDKGASEGLRRSWKLTEKYFWRVFGTKIAATIIVDLATVVPSYSIKYLTSWLSIPLVQAQLIGTIIGQLILVVILPFSIAVGVLIYYDLLIRVEGFDLAFAVEAVPG